MSQQITAHLEEDSLETETTVPKSGPPGPVLLSGVPPATGESPSGAVVYRIKNWDDIFENNRTREMKNLQWVPVPNKHDGEGFQTLMAQPNGIILYGCFHLILQVASKSHPRGTLLRSDGTPLTAQAISIKTGWRRVCDIQASLDFCSSAEVGWIERITTDGKTIPHLPAVFPHRPAQKGREGKGRELKEGKGTDSPESGKPTRVPVVPQGESIINIPINGPIHDGMVEYPITQSLIDEWHSLYPSLNILGTLREIRAWNLANPKKRKTWGGVQRHIVSWLTREQNQ